MILSVGIDRFKNWIYYKYNMIQTNNFDCDIIKKKNTNITRVGKKQKYKSFYRKFSILVSTTRYYSNLSGSKLKTGFE